MLFMRTILYPLGLYHSPDPPSKPGFFSLWSTVGPSTSHSYMAPVL